MLDQTLNRHFILNCDVTVKSRTPFIHHLGLMLEPGSLSAWCVRSLGLPDPHSKRGCPKLAFGSRPCGQWLINRVGDVILVSLLTI